MNVKNPRTGQDTGLLTRPETAAEVLDIIDDFFLRSYDPVNEESTEEASALWNVLTALRGPDDGSIKAKEHGTTVVRGASFPRTLAKVVAQGTQFTNNTYAGPGGGLWSPAENHDPEKYNAHESWHFQAHLQRAVTALYNMGRMK